MQPTSPLHHKPYNSNKKRVNDHYNIIIWAIISLPKNGQMLTQKSKNLKLKKTKKSSSNPNFDQF